MQIRALALRSIAALGLLCAAVVNAATDQAIYPSDTEQAKPKSAY